MNNLTKYKMKLQEDNRNRVYAALIEHPGASSTRLTGLTGLSAPTVLKIMREIKFGWKPEGVKQ